MGECMSEQPPLRIAVCGGAEPQAAHVPLAEAVGALLATAGAIVVCGGRGGIMEAAARGAAGQGGFTIGVLPGRDARDANGYIALPLPTGMGEMRNMLVVTFAESVIAIGGEWGTMSEIAFAMKIGRPVVLLEPTIGRGLPVDVASSPDDAVQRALAAARAARRA
jgi:uncharacterized protein (TIGR00725 family)